MTTRALTDALDQLTTVARAAGLSESDARLEGLQLSATISEPARGAFKDWATQTGEVGGAERFFDCASRGRRWRNSPTTLMTQLSNTDPRAAGTYADALAAVAAAACLLGEPHPQVAGNATLAASAQRSIVPAAFHPSPIGPISPNPKPPAPVSTSPSPQPNSGSAGVSGPLPSYEATAPTGEESWVGSMADAAREGTDAMGDFTKRAPDILQNVLGQLKGTQERMRSLGMRTPDIPAGLSVNPFDISSLDPHSPGAFGSITTDSAPVGENRTGGTAEPGAAVAPVQTQDDPDAKAAEPEPEPQPPAKSLEELLAELDELVGLDTVKSEIHRQTAILRVQGLRAKAGLQDPTITRHLVFVGNPGTGKTTVARLVAGIYKALGLLSKGQLVEVDRSELVAGYLGQTAIKTAEIADKAKGGVLFIDEAYSLSGDQYGEEAINTLVKEMEDNRHDLVVIVAGYPRPMSKFIAENPGLASRFRTTIDFADYTDAELVAIFEQMAAKADYDVTDEVLTTFRMLLAQQVRDETFGNGRFARNTLEAAIGKHAWRLRDTEEPTLEQLRTILPEDVSATSSADTVDFSVDDPSTDHDAATEAVGEPTGRVEEIRPDPEEHPA